MSNTNTDETHRKSRTAFRAWNDFLYVRGADDVFMRGWSYEDRLTLLVLWIGDLADRKVCVSDYVQGLRKAYSLELVCTLPFDDRAVSAARATATLEVKPQEQRQRESEQNVKLAADWPLVDYCYNRWGYEIPDPFVADRVDPYMTALAIRLGFHEAARPGEFAHSKKARKSACPEDPYNPSTLRSKNVQFMADFGDGQGEVAVTSGQASHPVDVTHVRSMSFVLRAQKTSHGKVDPLAARYEVIDPRLVRDDQGGDSGRRRVQELLVDLWRWADWSGARGDDLFFSNWRQQYRGKFGTIKYDSHKVLTVSMVTEMLKQGARALGRDDKYFSAKSLKKGAVQTMQAHTLATPVELATFARHANPASTAHYMCNDSCRPGATAYVGMPVVRPLGDPAQRRAIHGSFHAPQGINPDGSPLGSPQKKAKVGPVGGAARAGGSGVRR